MVDFGSGQGRSDFATAGVVRLRRGLQRARTPAWAERCRLWMDTNSPPAHFQGGFFHTPARADGGLRILLHSEQFLSYFCAGIFSSSGRIEKGESGGGAPAFAGHPSLSAGTARAREGCAAWTFTGLRQLPCGAAARSVGLRRCGARYRCAFPGCAACSKTPGVRHRSAGRRCRFRSKDSSQPSGASSTFTRRGGVGNGTRCPNNHAMALVSSRPE